MTDLSTAKAMANQRVLREQRKIWGKKSVVKMTADQTIDRLCMTANAVLEAFFKNSEDAVLREAMKDLQGEIALAGKRIRK